MKSNNFSKAWVLILLLLTMRTSFGQTNAKAVIKQPSAALVEQIRNSEEKLRRLDERATRYQELHAREMVSRREWEAAQDEAEKERLSLAELRSGNENDAKMALLLSEFAGEKEFELLAKLLNNANADVTKIRSELKDFRAAQPSPALIPLGNSGGYVRRTNAFARFAVSGYWSLKDAGQIQLFFQARFRRNLPISAFGQSALHSRWNYDHRNAMDVALHPDSVEGRALVAYLESRNIPFAAFRQAIPGSATAPHIHIGLRSNHFR